MSYPIALAGLRGITVGDPGIPPMRSQWRAPRAENASEPNKLVATAALTADPSCNNEQWARA
jgi:hypothetical protein